jgi:hypothetical protein
MGRLLGVRRLSHDTDASTSIERQGESIEHWAMAHGRTVVALTQDTGVRELSVRSRVAFFQ